MEATTETEAERERRWRRDRKKERVRVHAQMEQIIGLGLNAIAEAVSTYGSKKKQPTPARDKLISFVKGVYDHESGFNPDGSFVEEE